MTANTNRSVDSGDLVLKINDGSSLQDISPYIVSYDFPSSWKNNPATTFGSLGERQSPGIFATKFTVELLLNQVPTVGSQTVVGAMHAAKALRAFELYPFGTAAGNLKITGNIRCPDYHMKGKSPDLQTVDATFEIDNGHTFGTAS